MYCGDPDRVQMVLIVCCKQARDRDTVEEGCGFKKGTLLYSKIQASLSSNICVLLVLKHKRFKMLFQFPPTKSCRLH